MPRPRFSLRWMMVAVAVAGVVSVAVATKWRREHFAERAAYYSKRQRNALALANKLADYAEEVRRGAMALRTRLTSTRFRDYSRFPLSEGAVEYLRNEDDRATETYALAAKQRENASWHSRMKLKYEHAARYPWLAVAPDPPEPE